MKLSTVLLSSAALLVAGAAYAADLPAKKAAPAAAPTGCAAFGAGFIQIPGGDTCLAISGSYYVTGADTSYGGQTIGRSVAQYSMSPEFDLTIKANNNTEAGVLASKVQLDFTKSAVGFDTSTVSLGGLEFGYVPTAFNMINGGDTNEGGGSGLNNGNKSASVHYTIPMGASSVTVGVENGSGNFNNTSAASQIPDLTGKAKFGFGSSSVTLVGGAHQAYGSSSGSAWGYAYGAYGSFAASKDTTVLVGGAATSGALGMLGLTGGTGTVSTAPTLFSGVVSDTDVNSSNPATGYSLEAAVNQKFGNDELALYASYGKANASSGTAETSYNGYMLDAAYKHTIAKGLWVTPELNYTSISQTNSLTSTSGFIRIGRDF